MKRHVIILGAGISSLFAAYRLYKEGIPFEIWESSKKVNESIFSGAISLKDNCGLPLEVMRVFFFYTGAKPNTTPEDYYRLYNKKLGRKVRNYDEYVQHFTDGLDYYSMRDAYDYLYKKFYEKIRYITLTKREIWDLFGNQNYYVISSIPRPIWDDFSNFKTTISWVRWMHLPKIDLPIQSCVIHNVDPNIEWFRYSHYNDGVICYEYTKKQKDSFKVNKVDNVLEQLDEVDYPNVMLIGRQGKWDRHYLAHTSYYDVEEKLEYIKEYLNGGII